jgi:hypothetical protein
MESNEFVKIGVRDEIRETRSVRFDDVDMCVCVCVWECVCVCVCDTRTNESTFIITQQFFVCLREW